MSEKSKQTLLPWMIGIIVLAVSLVEPVTATAGTATVSQCRSLSGVPASVDATFFDDRPSWLGITTCGAGLRYMGVASYGERASDPPSDVKALEFRAPGTTHFTGMTLHRQLTNYAYSYDPDQPVYDSWGLGYRLVDDAGRVLERCGAADLPVEGPGQCRTTNFTTSLNAAVFSSADVLSKKIEVQFGCFSDTYCKHFFDAPAITDVYGDFVVEDDDAPVVEEATGPLASSDTPITSVTDDLTISATDSGGLGVLGLQLTVDGADGPVTAWANQSASCVDADPGSGYRYAAGQPCSATPPAMSWTLPHTADGSHDVRLAVVDAAGNQSTVLRRSLVIDRLAPELGEDPRVEGTPEVGQDLRCSIGGVQAQDPRMSYQWIRTRADGSDAQELAGATGNTYKLTDADSGSKLLCRVTVTDRGGSTSRTSSLTSGPFEGGQAVTGATAGGQPPSNAGGAGGGNGAAAGTGAPATGNLTLGTASAGAAGPSGQGSSQGPATPAPGCPVGTLVTLDGSLRLVAKRTASATRISGAVRSGSGAPAPGVVVDLVQRVRRNGVTPTTVASGVSGADGRFALKAPVGPSRDLQVVTRACGAAGPVVGQSVRGEIKVKTVNPHVRNGQTVRFSGQAVGGYYGKGVGLELQVLVGRKWQDVRAVRTDAKGRFKSSYRFKRTYVRFTYQFRVITRATAGWPYTATRSPVAKVRVN